jgi:cytoskeletal protein CcmA (bactofilin family)
MGMHFGFRSSAASGPTHPEPPDEPPAEAAASFIGPGVRLVGVLRSDHELTIRGRVEGPVVARGRVVVERDGFVEGDITAPAICVRGETRGTLVGISQITLESGSDHRGSLQAPSLVIEAGASVRGEVSAGRDVVAGEPVQPEGSHRESLLQPSA